MKKLVKKIKKSERPNEAGVCQRTISMTGFNENGGQQKGIDEPPACRMLGLSQSSFGISKAEKEKIIDAITEEGNFGDDIEFPWMGVSQRHAANAASGF